MDWDVFKWLQYLTIFCFHAKIRVARLSHLELSIPLLHHPLRFLLKRQLPDTTQIHCFRAVSEGYTILQLSSPSPMPVHWGSFLLTMINAGENVLLMISFDSVIAETKVKYCLGIWYIIQRIKGQGNSLHFSHPENSMDRGALWTTVHGITNSGHDWVTSTFTMLIPTY